MYCIISGPSHQMYVVNTVPLSPRIIISPLELGSATLGQSDSVVFLSNNNTQILAHQGSSVTLSCKLTKPPNSGMVGHIPI